MSEVKLVYFDIRGFAEPIRWMLKIAGQPFVDERIPLDAWAGMKKRNSVDNVSLQTGEKGKKRRSFDKSSATKFIGQLPILYIDDFVLSQTQTVTRYVARRFGFNGRTAEHECRADEVCELLYDLRLCAVAYDGCFNSETPDIMRHTVFRDFKNEPNHLQKEFMKQELLEIHFPKYFEKFRILLEKSKGKYITDDTLSYADLSLANFFAIVEEMVDPDCLSNFPTLKNLKEDIFSIPEVKASLKAAELNDTDAEAINPEGG